jgi:hypothetical protein
MYFNFVINNMMFWKYFVAAGVYPGTEAGRELCGHLPAQTF